MQSLLQSRKGLPPLLRRHRQTAILELQTLRLLGRQTYKPE